MRVRLTTWWTEAGYPRAWFAGAAVSGAAGWVSPAGRDVMDRTYPSSYVAYTFSCLLRLGAG